MGSLRYSNGTCRFRVWAPFAVQVEVMGDFTNWETNPVPLASEGNGNWSTDVANVPDKAMYKYRIQNVGGGGNDNSQIWKHVDPRAFQIENSSDQAACYVIDQQRFRASSRPTFATPRFENFIVYQAHVGTMNGRNDLRARPIKANNVATFLDVVDKLDYLHSLGFNVIELLPIGENQGDLSEGYSPCHQYAPEDAYATSKDKAVDELLTLVDAAHAKGMAVFFDVVYNHAPFNENMYWRYDGNCFGPPDGGIYFEKGHHTQFGDGFAMWRQEVKDFFLDNTRMLLREYRVDGLRFDAVHLIPPDAIQYIVGTLRSEFPDKYLIAEYNPSDSNSAAAPMDPFGALGFHATWDMNGTGQAYAALSGSSPVDNLLTLIGDFRNPNPWRSVRYPTGCHDDINRQTTSGLDKAYIVERFGGRSNGYARAKARLAWALAVAIPGTPMMFMGTDGDQDTYWDWTNDPGRGDHRVDWALIGDPTGIMMQRLVRGANQVRWDHPALRSAAGNVAHIDRVGQVVAFKRYTGGGDLVLVVINVSDNQWAFHDYCVNLGGESGSWLEIFNSQAPEYGGFDSTGNFGERLTAAGEKLFINLPRWSVVMFRKL
jgi:1,4-alpha-glucan branching enzyme